jgi:hypothetical protein
LQAARLAPRLLLLLLLLLLRLLSPSPLSSLSPSLSPPPPPPPSCRALITADDAAASFLRLGRANTCAAFMPPARRS